MHDADAKRILDRLLTCTLPKPEWTHEAHLAACWAMLQQHSSHTALERLRRSIRTYNLATGVANTATSGYHETITRYYVGALASLAGHTARAALDDDRCSRTAPLEHWTKDRLFSEAARADWVEPDLAPLPWETPAT